MDYAPSRFNCRVLLVAVMLAGISVLAHAQQTTGASRARANAKTPTPGLYGVGRTSDCSTLTWEAMFWPGGVLQIGRGEKLDASSRVLDSNRIQRTELNEEGEKETITYTRCDERRLPADVRYFDEPRKLTALPIKPGYYALRYEGSVAEYFLFDTNRIAWMDEVAWDSRHNPTRRENVIRPLVDIRQVGPRIYTFAYQQFPRRVTDENTSVPVLIEAPNRFSGWFVENGIIRYEPVDAKQIPAALRPHF
jgi:hypothetical protein